MPTHPTIHFGDLGVADRLFRQLPSQAHLAKPQSDGDRALQNHQDGIGIVRLSRPITFGITCEESPQNHDERILADLGFVARQDSAANLVIGKNPATNSINFRCKLIKISKTMLSAFTTFLIPILFLSVFHIHQLIRYLVDRVR